MRFEDLSREDQHLLQTDLGEFDKIAADQVALIDEMYSTGFNKLAAETADWLDKLAEKEEEEEEEEKDIDHEGEKTAATCGDWTERGFFDGLRKLGSERYGSELHYLLPFIQEKIANQAAQKAEEVVHHFINQLPSSEIRSLLKNNGQSLGMKGKEALKGIIPGFMTNVRKAVTGEKHKDVVKRIGAIAHRAPQGSPMRLKMEALAKKNKLTTGQRATEGAKAVGKAGLAAGGTYGAYRGVKSVFGKKKEE